MKKALALVLALVLALSMAVSAFAVDFVELDPVTSSTSGRTEITVVDPDSDKNILYTTLGLDAENLTLKHETVYYIALNPDTAYTDVKVTANGNVTAELVDFDFTKMDVVDKDGESILTYCVTKKGEVVQPEIDTYEAAVEHCKYLSDSEKVSYYAVECEQNVNIIKVTVENNFSASFTEGTLKIEAKVGKKDYAGSLTIINDVTIFEYEEVKYAAANYANGASLQLGAKGYSDYFTAENGYSILGEDYDVENMRDNPFALVVSTTAFRAIEGKNLKLDVLTAKTFGNLNNSDSGVSAAIKKVLKNTDISVTLKNIAKGQKGVNFFATAGLEGMKYEDGKLTDRYPSAICFGFKGEQVIVGEFEINFDLPINWYQLREVFGIKVEEEDIISYYLIDENGKVVGGKEVDYMTADVTENASFTIKGENQKLGSYKLVIEVPTAGEGESNPNTGAESVVGVVAALAVVSVATAAAVSLKK